METKTELQNLLHRRLEEMTAKYKEVIARRDRLEEESRQLQSDIATLNEALRVEERSTGKVIMKPPSNGSRLIGLKLMDAIRLLREENPSLTKIKACYRLQEAGFDFKDKKPRRAVHMAWTVLERQKHKDDDT